MPWEELSLEDTNNLRVKSEPELSDGTTELGKDLLQYSVKDILYTNASPFEQEGWTTTDIEREDSYETNIQFKLGQQALRQFAVLVEKQSNWNRDQPTKTIMLTLGHVKNRMERFFDSANSTIHSWFNPFILNDLQFYISDLSYVDMVRLLEDVSIFELGEPTTANIARNDLYKTIILSQQKHKILDRLAVIAQRENNWDGYDSKKPSKLTIRRAEHFIKELLDNDDISAKLLQLEPFICSDEDGYITIECYKGKRSLCFDIQENETKYTKIEKIGANTTTQTGSLNQDNYLPLLECFLDE